MLTETPVSVIFTVLNESKHVYRLLDSLATQTHLPDEVVICDGGSTDGTVDQINDFVASHRLPKINLIVEDGANISRGRNVAIEAAQGPIIASTDVGVRLVDEWLERLVEPWNSSSVLPVAGEIAEGGPTAVAGFFLPDVNGIFTAAMGATVLPLSEDIDPNTFLPSSRSVAFTKAAWQAANGYPEWLDFCEDLLFDFAINEQKPESATAFVWAPQAIAYFQPRTNLLSFWKQYYRYARGDGKADLWRKRHAARYITYLLFLPLLLFAAFWGSFGGGLGAGLVGEKLSWVNWLGWLCLFAGGFVYCWRPWQRLSMVGADLSPL